MKKSLTSTVALLAGAFTVHCQGTIGFEDYAVLSPYIYVSLGPTLLGGSNTVTTGVPEIDVSNGHDWTVALYGNAGWNDLASNLVQIETGGGQPVTATLETENLDDATAGTWIDSAGIIGLVPGTTGAGDEATVQLRAWYNRGGEFTNYEAALSAGLPVGVSALGNCVTGENTKPPRRPPDLPQLGNVILAYPTNVSQSGPFLTIQSNASQSGTSEPNSLILTWPTNSGELVLQSTTNTGSQMIWTNVPSASTVVNGQNTVTNSVSGAQQFFRLSSP